MHKLQPYQQRMLDQLNRGGLKPGEQDQVFVATNNKVDAVMIALKYS